MSEFHMDPAFATATSFIADWPLCRVLLMEDRRYPWLQLLPRRLDVTEILHLLPGERVTLMEEIARAGEAVLRMQSGVKLNIGTLGNLVPQLHIHVLGRWSGDPAWPGPVWGHSPAEPYDAAERARRIAAVLADTGP